MIRTTLLLLLLSLGITGFCSTPIDSLKAKISRIEKVDQKRIDSLQKELHFYKVKEGFYSDAFSSQGTLYSALMGIISTLIVAIGISFIITRINKVKADLEEKLADNIEKNKELEFNIAVSYTHFLLYQAAASREKTVDYLKHNERVSGLIEAMTGVKHFCTAYAVSDELLNNHIEQKLKIEHIDKEVKSLINKAKAACAGLSKSFKDQDNSVVTNRKRYASRLSNTITDSDLDDLVCKYNTSEVRQSFYNFKSELALLIEEFNKDLNK